MGESQVSGLDFDDTELMLGLPGDRRKRAYELALGDGSTDSRDSKVEVADVTPPSSKAQVVGWPPVRSFRKNVLKSCTYVKVAVDGVPFLRKVDLEAYTGYQQLLIALEELFCCFKIRYYGNDKKLVDPVNGTGYVPTYEDKDGDWMLVGDVPWKMFIESCKRIWLMKGSDAIDLAPRETGRSSQPR